MNGPHPVSRAAPEAPKPSGPLADRSAFVIFTTVALDTMAASILAPVFPGLIRSISHGSTADIARWIGLAITLFAVMQFLCAPVQGGLSDRYGRRPVIIGSTLALAASYLMTALAPTVWILVFSRAVAGGVSASSSVAYAYLTDVTPPAKRASVFGALGAAAGIGAVLGPSLGAAMMSIDVRAPLIASAVLSLVNALGGSLFLRESRPAQSAPTLSLAMFNPLSGLRGLLRQNPAVLLWLGGVFAAVLAVAAVNTVGSVFLLDELKWTVPGVAVLLTAFGLVRIIAQAVLVAPVLKLLGERGLISASLILGAMAYVLFGAGEGAWAIWVAMMTLALGSVGTPVIQAALTRSAGPGQQGQVQGVFRSITASASIVGPGVFASVFALAIERGGSRLAIGAPFYVAGGLMVLALVFIMLALRTPRTATAKALNPSLGASGSD